MCFDCCYTVSVESQSILFNSSKSVQCRAVSSRGVSICSTALTNRITFWSYSPMKIGSYFTAVCWNEVTGKGNGMVGNKNEDTGSWTVECTGTVGVCFMSKQLSRIRITAWLSARAGWIRGGRWWNLRRAGMIPKWTTRMGKTMNERAGRSRYQIWHVSFDYSYSPQMHRMYWIERKNLNGMTGHR
jgi:hypothetical protein